MALAIAPAIERLIATDAPVAIGVSGGKDSQAAALEVCDHLDRAGHAGPRLLVHADLGSVEWRDSLPHCQDLADHLGLELVVLRRQRGDLMSRWESRWQSSVARYEDLATVTLVPCWSTPAMRFCTSEMKSHPIAAMLRRRFPGRIVVNVTGVRRAESRRRARLDSADPDRDGRIWTWRPLLDWSEEAVFSSITRRGLDPHPAYGRFGMSRVSCRFCIMSSLPDLIAAAAQPESHDLYRRMVALEIASSFAFQGGRWLGDIAPHLLGSEDRNGLAAAKERARLRIEAERRITRPMLYVRGWPTRMLTDDEADILASVRREVTALFGFRSRFLDRDAIHGRYDALLAERSRRKAA
ncbi:phosphoadenosine phosphosulfate reductase domain-containing protein [Neoaquamicrobium sediminum]|uniref:phosphoadenosine phosphosulfate reductase domain-containing protein n=1 Tax=Neoaquamicrobium sediminum TaxID=1849104 RepID=UPI001565CDE2|nr:phosphoadenosine phosphosulfate reductase family protein [Mesorhizobium sediminum]NRC57295.1 phosphoadenosine phosphosulfate reductase family protein [Mesorhizobium sediminum]